EFFFFFQAEDGIRDKLVTGVQTCALPISAEKLCAQEDRHAGAAGIGAYSGAQSFSADVRQGKGELARGSRVSRVGGLARQGRNRSEERRVGKECGGGGVGDSEGKK